MALTARLQKHKPGQFDDSAGRIRSKNKETTAAVITYGQVLTADGAHDLRACAATDKGPIYVANEDKVLNDNHVDAMWGENGCINYVKLTGALDPNTTTDLECAAGGTLAQSGGTNPVVARYVKHGTKTHDGVTDLPAGVDGDTIGIVILPQGQG